MFITPKFGFYDHGIMLKSNCEVNLTYSINTTETAFVYFEKDINANVFYHKLLTCNVDSPGPDEVHLVPHEDEGCTEFNIFPTSNILLSRICNIFQTGS